MIRDGKTIGEWYRAAESSEIRAYMLYGGYRHIAFLNGEVVDGRPYGCVIPDITRIINGRIEIIEVKCNNLVNWLGLSKDFNYIRYQIERDIKHVPKNSLFRVVIDTREVLYEPDYLLEVRKTIKEKCWDIYKNLPVDFI